MGGAQHWSDRWRSFIRAGETALVAGLWIGGVTASDALISALLLLVGTAVGIGAVVADPVHSRIAKALSTMAIVALFGMGGALLWWRHQAAQSYTGPSTPSAEAIAKQVEGWLQSHQVASPVAEGTTKTPSQAPPRSLTAPQKSQADTPHAPKTVRDLSDATLAQEMVELAHKLLAFQGDVTAAFAPAVAAIHPDGSTIDPAAGARFTEVYTALDNEYREKFRVTELEFRNEVKRRVLVTATNMPASCEWPERLDKMLVGANYLAGPHPMGERASCLQDMSKLLVDSPR